MPAVDARLVRIDMADNGRGVQQADLSRAEAWGVAGMHERARHFGGLLAVGPGPDGGTVVSVSMPLEGERDG